MNFHDVELLSTYLDGQLSPSDSARLEARLKTDAGLRAIMDDLRLSRGVLRSLPARGAPRSFALTPKMVGIKAPEPRAYPAFRFATVLAALLFAASVALNGLASAASSHLALQAAPAYGYGAGGGPCDTCGTEAPPPAAVPLLPAAPQSFTAALPTETLPAEQDKSQALAAPTAQVVPESIPPANGAAPRNTLPIPPPSLNNTAKEVPSAPVPLGWQIGLAGLALVCGLAAGLVRLTSERKFRDKWKMK